MDGEEASQDRCGASDERDDKTKRTAGSVPSGAVGGL